jgi:hypothetical protein
MSKMFKIQSFSYYWNGCSPGNVTEHECMYSFSYDNGWRDHFEERDGSQKYSEEVSSYELDKAGLRKLK